MSKGDTTGLVENHHRIPKSLGGTDDEPNMVKLSPKQHFIAHLLLIKMLAGLNKQKMLYALRSMANLRHSKGRSYFVGARIYARIRRELRSHPMSQMQRNKISAALCGRKLSKDHRQKIGCGLLGRIQSQTTRDLIAVKNRNKVVSDRTRAKISASKLGFTMSEVNKQAIREALQRPRTESWNRNNSLGHQKFSYSLISPDGVDHETTNLKTFCAENNLVYSSFSAASRVGGKSSGWWVSRQQK